MVLARPQSGSETGCSWIRSAAVLTATGYQLYRCLDRFQTTETQVYKNLK